ncbi:MAG: NINE protein [Myroides sp.]
MENQNSEGRKEEQWHTGPNPSNFNQQQNQYGNQQNNYQNNNYQAPPSYIQDANSKKILAGILAIFLGHLGIHKFVLGYNTEGIILLIMGLVGYVTACFIVGYFVLFVAGVIGLIEGIIYLTKSDEDFFNTYIRNRKPWF